MEVTQCDSVELWKCESVILLNCGGVIVWKSYTLEVIQFGRIILCKCDGVV